MDIGFYELPASLLAWIFGLVHSYGTSLALIAVIVMAVVTPLVIKSTEGMLKMQTLAPELRRIQKEFAGDRAAQQQEQMKLYQESGVNPMASCWPLAIQMPIFIIMFRILHGLTYIPEQGNHLVARAVMNASGVPKDTAIGFYPRFISETSELYTSLVHQTEMNSWGLDLSKSTMEMLSLNTPRGLIYIGVVVLYGVLSLVQQKMVAARAAISPTMSATQAKMMQYLPVFFAVFQLFFLLALVIYYIFQTIIRIGQQAYITRRYYGHEEALGRKAQQASQKARELHGDDGGIAGMLKRAAGDGGEAKPAKSGGSKSGGSKNSPGKKSGSKNSSAKADGTKDARPTSSKNSPSPKSKRTGGKQTTAPKGRPTPKSQGGNKNRPKSKSKRRS